VGHDSTSTGTGTETGTAAERHEEIIGNINRFIPLLFPPNESNGTARINNAMEAKINEGKDSNGMQLGVEITTTEMAVPQQQQGEAQRRLPIDVIIVTPQDTLLVDIIDYDRKRKEEEEKEEEEEEERRDNSFDLLGLLRDNNCGKSMSNMT
jgi:hypothetical protein